MGMGLSDRSITIVVDLPTLLSFVIFVGTSCLYLTRQDASDTPTQTSSVSSEDEDVADDTSREEDGARYVRRRLQNRLSFSFTTAEDERDTPANVAGYDFLPRNSNWQHFEPACSSLYPSVSGPDSRPRPALSVHTSLAGEAWSTTKDENFTDEEEFSLTSADHFVWTKATYSPKKKKRALRSPALRSGDTTSTPQSEDVVGTERGLRPPPPVSRPHRSVSMPLSNRKDSHAARVRASYNARIMPNKVVLLRHGQSLGNIDETIYSRTPDNAIPLTKLGWEQAHAAGRRLKYTVLPQNCNIHFIVSPYVRTVETFHGILSAWCDPKSLDHITDRQERIKAWYSRLLDMGITWAEDPRIREQVRGALCDARLLLLSNFAYTLSLCSLRISETSNNHSKYFSQKETGLNLEHFISVSPMVKVPQMSMIEYLHF
jgi:hypothetical protein